ncbi:MAG TPA: methyltransferase domain-containing protein, partial [Thermoanaerobaculia bacterium]|nr:methyltransferase domain-containing protein [Thermoanaerobaculia bacterium]
QLAAENVRSLGETFDLVLSNNVFEHVADIAAAVRACFNVVRPGGRLAIFTDPLYYSSAGSHLPLEPWEHLWADHDTSRARIINMLPKDHALHHMSMQQFLFREITLNRMRLSDFVAAISGSGFAILNIRLIPDRHLSIFSRYRDRLQDLSVMDLTIEGIAVELIRLADSELPADDLLTTEQVRSAAHQVSPR